MAVEEDPPAGVPDWVLTYGDMMSLLLTFFIMLVSMSEMKKDDKFQGVADSLEKQFGHDTSQNALSPGEFLPRNTTNAAMTAAGRVRRKNIVDGGSRAKAVHGAQKRVEMVRPGQHSSVGALIPFADDSIRVDDAAMGALDQVAERFRGKPQIIEITGHASHRHSAQANGKDSWDTSYARCREVMRLLIEKYELEPERMRISVAGPYDPILATAESETVRSRVEVYLRQEVPNTTSP